MSELRVIHLLEGLCEGLSSKLQQVADPTGGADAQRWARTGALQGGPSWPALAGPPCPTSSSTGWRPPCHASKVRLAHAAPGQTARADSFPEGGAPRWPAPAEQRKQQRRQLEAYCADLLERCAGLAWVQAARHAA